MFEKVEKLGLKNGKRHIFLCTESGEGKCCLQDNLDSWNYLKKRLNELKIDGTANILRTKASCLRICESGPIGVVYPEGVWYHSLNIENLEKVIKNHLINGHIVQELVIIKNELE